MLFKIAPLVLLGVASVTSAAAILKPASHCVHRPTIKGLGWELDLYKAPKCGVDFAETIVGEPLHVGHCSAPQEIQVSQVRGNVGSYVFSAGDDEKRNFVYHLHLMGGPKPVIRSRYIGDTTNSTEKATTHIRVCKVCLHPGPGCPVATSAGTHSSHSTGSHSSSSTVHSGTHSTTHTITHSASHTSTHPTTSSM